MTSDQSTSKTPFLRSRTFKGFLPWIILAAALLLLDHFYDYRVMGAHKNPEGFERNTAYTIAKTPEICVDQGVFFFRGTGTFFRDVAAIEGQSFGVEDLKIVVNGKVAEFDQEWHLKAIQDLPKDHAGRVAPGHVLILNPLFIKGDGSADWALDHVPLSDVKSSFSRVLFSRNLSRIGQPAKSYETCMPWTKT